MTFRWYLAKYIDDLRRREPKNVGVLLSDGERTYMRFIGQREDGSINGRIARFPESLQTYKAWVRYWEREFSDVSDLAETPRVNSSSNYYLEPGGERLVGQRDDGPEELLTWLYRELVEPKIDEGERIRAVSIAVSSRNLLRAVGLLDKVEQNVTITATVNGLTDDIVFDYRYRNAATHLMKNVKLGPDWEPVHAAFWSFEKGTESLPGARFIAFTKAEERYEERQFSLLERLANVVDVDDPDAEATLGSILNN